MKVIVKYLLVSGAVCAAVILWCGPPRASIPVDLMDFAHETAKKIPNCKVCESRHGLPQCWLTTGDVSPPELRYKFQRVEALDDWRGLVVVRPTEYLIVVTLASPEEMRRGCAATIGDVSLWGDPELIAQIRKVWRSPG